jgi:hypothetical protein
MSLWAHLLNTSVYHINAVYSACKDADRLLLLTVQWGWMPIPFDFILLYSNEVHD